MRRAIALGVVLGAAIAVLGVPGTAIAGGGCHGGVTQQDARDEDEATVRMIDACFEATITAVDPGTPVTFVNTDQGVTHNVGGNLWGRFEDMHAGDVFRATFDEAGVYPFACSYHQGMTGAIVVGTGAGAGNGETVSIVPFEAAAEAIAPAAADADVGSAIGFVGIGFLGAGLGVAVGVGIGRLRRDLPSS
jgi:plastocyanin